ncbi:octopamine receptor beta-2R-like [Bolinopsis microptera]|uniref:octopamine receptor beta-2R-like n=1 Tax=Bolinopsis microptera TaxID=2820187 RepID=UPI0030791623
MATTPPYHLIYLDRLLGTVFCLIALIGFLSNGLMGVHLIALKKKFKTRTTSLLVQISAADFLTCLTVAPAVGGWVSSAMNGASLYLICVLSIDRFYAVFYPLHRPCILTNTRLTVLCATSWLIPVVSNTYPFFRGAHFFYYDILGFYVSTPLVTSGHEQNVIYIVSNVSVLLPFCVTVGFCLAVVSRLAQYAGRPKPGINLELHQPVSVLAPKSKKLSVRSHRSSRRLGRILTRMKRIPTSQKM